MCQKVGPQCLGHEGVTITLRHYAHAMRSLEEKAVSVTQETHGDPTGEAARLKQDGMNDFRAHSSTAEQPVSKIGSCGFKSHRTQTRFSLFSMEVPMKFR